MSDFGLGMNSRTLGILRKAGITTAATLVKQSPVDLLRLPNFGKGALNEVRAWLAERGLALWHDARYSREVELANLRATCAAQRALLDEAADTLERNGTLSLYWIDHLRGVQNDSPVDAGMRVSEAKSGDVLDGHDRLRAAYHALVRP